MNTLNDFLYGDTRGQTMPLEGLAALAALADSLDATLDERGVWIVDVRHPQDNSGIAR